ncbi:hypothetical protein [Rubrivivax sp. A210]|uniref:hypothetical protein n=1 Tax=Rubrivivax sp. A210 TaxID=2772301 RepID=UPI0019190F5D|nr:hypothetical protein [Rubrivivax sp. A210]
MRDGQLLEFHYYLADGLHSIDALRLNKLEAEALDVFLYISNQLGYDVALEATTATEGGYRQVWRFVKNPKNVAVTAVIASTLVGGATVAASVLNALIAAAVQIWVAPPKSDPELEKLQRDLLKKSIEEKELDISRKRNEAESAARKEIPDSDATPQIAPEFQISTQMKPLQLDVRVVSRRSNYYRLLLGEQRVTGVGLAWSETPTNYVREQRYIPRKEFVSYIVPTEPTAPEIVPNAFVEIVAPVIRSTDAKWRGVYLGKSISFAMRDADFKGGILRKGIQFQSGDSIECILRISYKINEVGEEIISGYEVLGVTKMSNTAEVGTGARRTSLKYQSKVPQEQLLLNFLTDENDAD